MRHAYSYNRDPQFSLVKLPSTSRVRVGKRIWDDLAVRNRMRLAHEADYIGTMATLMNLIATTSCSAIVHAMARPDPPADPEARVRLR